MVRMISNHYSRALLFAFVLVLAGNVEGYSQEADVKAAIDAYHAALSALDSTKMESLWAHDASVTLINPSGKSIAVGWDAVKKEWEGLFNVLGELKVTQADGPHISVKGDVAWSTGIASAVGKFKSGTDSTGATYESDVFEKRDGQWLLVSHVALRVPK
jgi:ketosteroid isomerase-like protein